MKSLICLIGAAMLAASCDARAVGRIAEVTIIDRDRGIALTPYYHRGEWWVAGAAGARYAITIRNRTGGRLLAVTSVDGVNVLSGESAAWNQTGYVFGPGQGYQVTGWRKSDADVAAFTFTASPNSYAARTGRPENVGVIGVAVFRERTPIEAYAPPQVSEPMIPGQDERASAGAARELAAPPAAIPPPAATPPSATRDSISGATVPSSPLASRLGTGYGAREYSYVSHTEFERLQSEPNEVIRIRYDSYENLVAMGIVRRPRPAPPGGFDPFPGSVSQYVPDPPG
jgi:hypothetical protein